MLNDKIREECVTQVASCLSAIEAAAVGAGRENLARLFTINNLFGIKRERYVLGH